MYVLSHCKNLTRYILPFINWYFYLQVMAELGNKLVNLIYEANTEGVSITRATPDCDT
jgi:hypothetical protein